MTAAHVEVVREWTDAHLERISVVETVRGQAPLEVLLGAGRFDPSTLDTAATVGCEARHADHGAGFDRWSLRTERPFDRERLRLIDRPIDDHRHPTCGAAALAQGPISR